ncbi:MAG: hypothetical protein ACI8W7_004035 [Gammaproteobacteria bacterium]|jgi:hypothetical protein
MTTIKFRTTARVYRAIESPFSGFRPCRQPVSAFKYLARAELCLQRIPHQHGASHQSKHIDVDNSHRRLGASTVAHYQGFQARLYATAFTRNSIISRRRNIHLPRRNRCKVADQHHQQSNTDE